MSEDNDQSGHKEQPIIIKKVKKGGHGGHHGGAWKVAYADFVTAMMAFFIVMWILASSEETKKSVEAYFDDPGAFSFVNGKRTIPIDLGLKPEPGKGKGEEGDPKAKGKKDAFMSFDQNSKDSILIKAAIKAGMDSVEAARKVEALGKSLQKELQKMIAQKPDLQEILSSIKIEMTKEGLRIELIESKESMFFEVGSSKVKKEARDLLIKLAGEIGKLPNIVDIEGHTDSRAFSSKNYYSNWELSGDRANAARKILESTGLWDGQIQMVAGFADKKLRNPGNPFDITNRRISILIKQLSAEQFIGNNGESKAPE